MIRTIAIVGLGQIGSSLGAAIRRRKLAGTVIGVARRREVREGAMKRGAVDAVSADPGVVVAADVVFLATPVRNILSSLPKIVRRMKPGALLTDVGSTKREILDRATRLLKAGREPAFRFIGGHPMAGNEKRGLEGCDPDLFVDRPWILIPSRARPSAKYVDLMTKLVTRLGARAHWMRSPAEHDRIAAIVSHLPHLVAYALLETAGPEALELAGNSFRDATRVGLSAPDMVLDFLLTNRKSLPQASRVFQKALRELTKAVSEGDRGKLSRRVKRARERRSGLS